MLGSYLDAKGKLTDRIASSAAAGHPPNAPASTSMSHGMSTLPYFRPMSPLFSRFLVFIAAASVLVLEILAGRLMAPFVGITLETFTGIIGTVLAGIAIGAWLGGIAADRFPPRSLLAPLFVAGGVLAMAAAPLVGLAGPSMRSAGPAEIVILAALAFFLPAAVLSAISPIVAKIDLASLDETGTVVGGLSAVGTAGAIFGTFFTGFVLIATIPSRPILIGLGLALIAIGGLVWWQAGQVKLLSAVTIPLLVALTLTVVVDEPCETETAYYCATIHVDPERPSGRVLVLDTLRHSYVDLEDPTYLGFRYSHLFGAVLDSLPDGPLDVLSIGGGGFTFPRYLERTRPGTENTVLEIDPTLVDVAVSDLGLDPSTMVIEVGDARLLLAEQPEAAYDVVIGDAFGGLSVPWHLTTTEFVGDIASRLRPDGIYLLNMIDYPPSDFARAEAATLASVFPHVAVIAPPDYYTGARGGNYVMVASVSPLPVAEIAAAIVGFDGDPVVITGTDLQAFIGDARVLRDDFAPVDQLISRP
jgi:spermidine synthase